MKKKKIRLPFILLALSILAYILSSINPYNRLAWFGQSAPAVLYVLLLVFLYPHFQFTNFTYMMVFLHVLLLLYGAHYTYSNNPIFTCLAEQFNWERNYFDRVGHFFQGFVPAFLFKEFYLRGHYVKRGRVLIMIILLSCLGLSAAYEIGEFAIVKIMNFSVEEVMGTQGDVFDSYWDMIWALIGSSLSVFGFGRFHDRYISRVEE